MSAGTRTPICGLAILALVLLAGAGPAMAHHSFAMFDQTKQVTLTGNVTVFE